MKKVFIIAAILLIASTASANDRYIQPYYQDRDDDGYRETHVQGHWRGDPDGNPYNNREYQREQGSGYQNQHQMPQYHGNDPYYHMKRNNRIW